MSLDKTLETSGLADLTPSSIMSDSQMVAAVEAVEPHLNAVVDMRTIPAILLHFDSLESEALDHLAVQWDISTWRDTWSVEKKRSILRTMFAIKSHVGTMMAVRDALSALSGTASVTEWWQKTPKGTPHTFSISVVISGFNGVVTDELQEDVMSLIDEAKPCRSHYEFEVKASRCGGIKGTGWARSLSFRRLKNF